MTNTVQLTINGALVECIQIEDASHLSDVRGAQFLPSDVILGTLDDVLYLAIMLVVGNQARSHNPESMI